MNSTDNPLLVVVVMVKNESSSLQATLASFSAGGIKHFFVLDTGSTDNTIALALDFFEKNQLVGFVEEEAFIDFASSRNRCLELAETCFPQASFFVMPDAEWHLQNPAALLDFCAQEYFADTPLYLIDIKMNAIEFATARLFRAANKVRFQGVVHEVPDTLAVLKVPESIYFEVHSTSQGIAKSKLRWEQDLLLLQKAFEENPEAPRTAFYLAQTHECLGQLEQAYHFYQHRSTLNGWDEENFITYFRLGSLALQLRNHAIDTPVTWDAAMNHFLKAYSLRPHRIEPLVKMAAYYWPSNIQACYLFIKQAYDIPYPKDDLLFIEKQMYTYDRYEIMSRCAWHLGEYALGKEATLRALEIHPEDMPHLKQNLALYEEKLAAL